MDDLKERQAASARVEKLLLEFIVRYGPAEDLKIADAQCIARRARSIAFDEFSPKQS